MELTGARRRSEHGFSVIETLIALFILTIGVAAMATGLTEGRRIAGEAEQRERATWSAQDKVTDKLARGFDRAAEPVTPDEAWADGMLVGRDEQAGVARMWWVEPDRPEPGMVRVSALTQWTRRGERRVYQISSLLARGQRE